MPYPSHVLAAGTSPLLSRTICGGGATALVAVGSSQTDALQLSATWNELTTSSGSTGVKLPTIEEGMLIVIYNLSGQTIQIYSHETTGVTMNAAVAGSTGVQIGNTKTAFCYAPSATHWVVTCALTST